MPGIPRRCTILRDMPLRRSSFALPGMSSSDMRQRRYVLLEPGLSWMVVNLSHKMCQGCKNLFTLKTSLAIRIPARKAMLTPKSAQMAHSGKSGQEFLIMIRALQKAVWI